MGGGGTRSWGTQHWYFSFATPAGQFFLPNIRPILWTHCSIPPHSASHWTQCLKKLLFLHKMFTVTQPAWDRFPAFIKYWAVAVIFLLSLSFLFCFSFSTLLDVIFLLKALIVCGCGCFPEIKLCKRHSYWSKGLRSRVANLLINSLINLALLPIVLWWRCSLVQSCTFRNT